MKSQSFVGDTRGCFWKTAVVRPHGRGAEIGNNKVNKFGAYVVVICIPISLYAIVRKTQSTKWTTNNIQTDKNKVQ